MYDEPSRIMAEQRRLEPVKRCALCGHPERHHDAGECWTDQEGQETSGETACPCWWYEPEEATK